MDEINCRKLNFQNGIDLELILVNCVIVGWKLNEKQWKLNEKKKKIHRGKNEKPFFFF